MAKALRGQAVNLGLVVLAIALVVVVVVTRGKVTTAEKEARSFNLLSAFREEEITRLSLTKAGQRLTLVRDQSVDAGDATWNITEPVQEEAEAYGIDKLLGSLEFARFVRRIKPEEVNRAEFGLEAPGSVLSVEMGKVRYELRMGNEAASPPGSRYLELIAQGGPESGVFIVGRDLVKELDVEAGTLRGRQMLPYTSNQLERVVITGTDGVDRKLKSAGRDRWRFDGMQADVRVNRDVFDQVLTQFARTKAEHFIEVKQAEAALAASKNVRLTLFPKDTSRPKSVIEVGGVCPKSENDVVALRREPEPVAACVPRSVLPGLDTPVAELVDTELFSLRKDEVESLLIVRGGSKLDLERKDAGFVLRSPVKAQVELETGNRRINAIVRARGEIVVGAKLAELGLDPPEGKITIRSPAESDEKVVEEVLELGKPDAGGKLPVRRQSDGIVLNVDVESARALAADSTLVRSLKIFDFAPSDFRQLEVRGRAVNQKLRREAGGQMLLEEPKGYTHDSALAANAVDELAGLSADRWVSDHDDKTFGLESPDLRVLLSFVSGDAGEKHHSLIVGASTTGGAFAKLEGEPGVFIFPRRALEALGTWLIDRSVFMVTPDDVTRVEIEHQGKKLVLEKRADHFVRSSGIDLPAARVSEIADTLIALRAEAAVTLGPAKTGQGLEKPEVVVRIERTGNGPKSLRIGSGDAWRGQSIYYARAEGVDATYVIAKTKIRVLVDAF